MSGTQISIRVDDNGVKLKTEKLAGALPQLTREELDAMADEWKFEASGGYSGGNSYTVPPVYGQTYIRTGTLGRSTYWIREGLTYRMKTEAYQAGTSHRYDEYVLGNASGAGQTWVFAGRWPNFLQVAQKWAAITIERMRKLAESLPGDFGL